MVSLYDGGALSLGARGRILLPGGGCVAPVCCGKERCWFTEQRGEKHSRVQHCLG